MTPEIRPKSFGTFEKQAPEQDLNPDLCYAGALLYQLSYQANWELGLMWVNGESFHSLMLK